MDGITKFCEELEVDPTDIVVLVISYYMVGGTRDAYWPVKSKSRAVVDGTWSCRRCRPVRPRLQRQGQAKPVRNVWKGI